MSSSVQVSPAGPAPTAGCHSGSRIQELPGPGVAGSRVRRVGNTVRENCNYSKSQQHQPANTTSSGHTSKYSSLTGCHSGSRVQESQGPGVAGPGVTGSRSRWVQELSGPGAVGSRSHRVQDSPGPGVPGSRTRQVQESPGREHRP